MGETKLEINEDREYEPWVVSFQVGLGLVVRLESFDHEHNHLIVSSHSGVMDAFPPVGEDGVTMFQRITGLIKMAQIRDLEFQATFSKE